MADLASILQGKGMAGAPQQPATPQIPVSPQVQQAEQVRPRAPASPEEFAQKKQNWVGVLKGIARNPDSMAALLVLGNRLAKPRLPGETGLSRMSEAVMQSRAMTGRTSALRQAAMDRKRAMLREYVKAQVEQYKAETGRMTAEASRSNAETNRGRLALDREKLPIERRELEARLRKLQLEVDKDSFGLPLSQRWAKVVDKYTETYGPFSDDEEIERMKRTFRMMNDLPADYELGIGGMGTGAGTGMGAGAGTGTGTSGADTGTGEGVSSRGDVPDDPAKLTYGAVYTPPGGLPAMWIGRPRGGKAPNPNDPNNWKPIR